MTIRENDIKLRILLAAKKLFANQGFEGTTVRQICEEAGANVALVSYYFGGKENMFGAIFETFFPNEQLAAIDPDMDPLKGVTFLIEQVTRYRYDDPDLITIVQQEVILNTPRIAIIRRHIMPMWLLLRKWLEKGQEQGVFQFRSVDTAFMSVIGTLLFHRQSDYWKVMVKEEPASVEELVEDLTAFLLNGLQTRK